MPTGGEEGLRTCCLNAWVILTGLAVSLLIVDAPVLPGLRVSDLLSIRSASLVVMV